MRLLELLCLLWLSGLALMTGHSSRVSSGCAWMMSPVMLEVSLCWSLKSSASCTFEHIRLSCNTSTMCVLALNYITGHCMHANSALQSYCTRKHVVCMQTNRKVVGTPALMGCLGHRQRLSWRSR